MLFVTVLQIGEIFGRIVGFGETSMKFGRRLKKVLGKTFGHRAIPDSFYEWSACHFTKWLPKYLLECCIRHSSGAVCTILLYDQL